MTIMQNLLNDSFNFVDMEQCNVDWQAIRGQKG